MDAEPNENPLARTLEPETMDDSQEVDEYGRMDHDAVNSAFVDDLLGGGPVGPRVVDLGCGTAAIAVLLCQRSSEVEVLGADASVEMLEAARIEIELGGVQGRVFLEHTDIKTLDGFEDATADCVISNTVLHHLPQPELAVAQALRILRPGGRLFIRDLFRPSCERELDELVETHAGQESDFARQLFRQSLHAGLTLAEIQSLIGKFGIAPEAASMTSDRHWTIDWTQ